MTIFGQSSPALPQLYRDQQLYQYTKTGFVSHLTRALETVGMVPNRTVWPWDPIASPEQVVPDGTTALFPFDYPDSSTFSFGGNLWRPCVVLCAWFGNYADAASVRRWDRLVLIDCIRRDGAFSLDSLYCRDRSRGVSSVFGFGLPSDSTEFESGKVDGARLEFVDWKPYSSFGGSIQNLLTVHHWFVYLGRAGLFVFLGTGTNKSQFGDVMELGYAFGGGRIPGRELTVDPNVGRINPIIPLFFKESNASDEQFNTSTLQYWSLVHGMQHDLKSQQVPVRCRLFNLENIEYPIFPNYGPYTVPSPRAVSGGSGAHILGRVVQVPSYREDSTIDLYGPIVPELTGSDVRPGWGDVFTAPSFRFCDRSAPIGNFEDPDTLTNWWIAPVSNSDQLVGLYAENLTEASALESLALSLISDGYYTMAGTPGWDFASLGGGLTAPTVTPATTSATAVVWTDASASDLMTATTTASGLATANATTDWVIPITAGDPIDTLYVVTFEAKNAGGAPTEGVNSLLFQRYVSGAFVTLLDLLSAGTNAALPGFDWVAYSYQVPLDSTAPSTPQLRVRWQADKDSGVSGNTAEVRNVHVLKYRYL